MKDIKEGDGIEISQKTVSNDLVVLKEEAESFVRDNRKQIAEEYKKVMSNLEQLRAEAWKQFRKIENKDSNVKVALYDTIQSINNNILNLLSIGDLIEIEMLQKAKQESDTTREDMNKTLEQLKSTQALV